MQAHQAAVQVSLQLCYGPCEQAESKACMLPAESFMGQAPAMETATIQNTAQACTWDCNFDYMYFLVHATRAFAPIHVAFWTCCAWLAHVGWMVHACNRRTCSCIAAC